MNTLYPYQVATLHAIQSAPTTRWLHLEFPRGAGKNAFTWTATMTMAAYRATLTSKWSAL